MTTVNKVTKQKLTTKYDELYQQILDATGMDLFGNKALTKYLNSGMSGVMQEIFDVIKNDANVRLHTLAIERKAMALLVYNRAMNGSKIPGCPTNVYTGEDCDWRALQDNANYRMAAFKEVKHETLLKWLTAIELIDRYK